jgi:hypothetical protein
MFNPSRGMHYLLFGHGKIIKGSKDQRAIGRVHSLQSSSKGLMHYCRGYCVQAEGEQHD